MRINSTKIHPMVKEAAAIFAQAGKRVYLVGGAVRDILRGRSAKDWDLATDARPEEVIALFGRNRPGSGARSFVVPTGIKHGTVTVHFRGLSMEVTTFRSESGYSDGRRPDRVEFGDSIEKDLSRRDFTMNAAAYKLPAGPLVDPFDGRADIKKRLIRTVGKPEDRFSEDGLRPVRALRFASQLDFAVDDALLAAVPGAIPLTARVAAERIRDELDKILVSSRPSAALLLMEKTGLLRLLLPELAACRGVAQDRGSGAGFHHFDVLDHSLLACDFAAKEGGDKSEWIEAAPDGSGAAAERGALPAHTTLPARGGSAVPAGNAASTVRLTQISRRLAALLHDTGKPAALRTGPGGEKSFHGHEKVSASIARAIMLRFRYPNAVTDRVCHLIEQHMFHYEENWTDAAVRRFIIRAGEANLPDLFALRRADFYGKAAVPPPPDFLLPLQKRIDAILARNNALSLKDLAVSGGDLVSLGIPPGKTMGIILAELLETVLDDPALNTREKLLEIAGKLNGRYM